MHQKQNKLIVILGPTASGKTKLAVKLASRFNGEIISADSRQVYQGMDVGTGKDLGEYIIKSKVKSQKSKLTKINYHLIDIISPKTDFSLAQYQRRCYQAIKNVWQRGKLPFLVGGTGLYIEAVLNNYQIPAIKPDLELRKKLERLDIDELLKQLKKLDKSAFNKVDKKNKRRVIRAIEVALNQKQETRNKKQETGIRNYDLLIIGIKKDKSELIKLIDRRVNKMLKQGLIEEAKKLHLDGVSWPRLESFGLEYKYTALFLQGKISRGEMIERIKISNRQFAKRQMTWFRGMGKRNKQNKIWRVENYKQAENLVKKFTEINRN